MATAMIRSLTRTFGAGLLAATMMLGGCQAREAAAPGGAATGRASDALTFPRADRPVARIVGNGFSSEPERDKLGEATAVMDLAHIGAGMSVADLGAGEGYYTMRLSTRVGAKGRVLAEDIDRGAVEKLGDRVERERRGNVSIRLGTADDPKLPDDSFDRVLLIHMYHEVAEPYAFLWRLRGALRPGGRVIVVELDQAPDRHGMPPALLTCEFAAVGLRNVQIVRKQTLQGYYAEFEMAGDRPRLRRSGRVVRQAIRSLPLRATDRDVAAPFGALTGR